MNTESTVTQAGLPISHREGVNKHRHFEHARLIGQAWHDTRAAMHVSRSAVLETARSSCRRDATDPWSLATASEACLALHNANPDDGWCNQSELWLYPFLAKAGQLQFSLNVSVLLDVCPYERLLHYRTPTEPGSSGSPVFNSQWEVVALHHAGSQKAPRLNRLGEYKANGAITFRAIRKAMGLINNAVLSRIDILSRDVLATGSRESQSFLCLSNRGSWKALMAAFLVDDTVAVCLLGAHRE